MQIQWRHAVWAGLIDPALPHVVTKLACAASFLLPAIAGKGRAGHQWSRGQYRCTAGTHPFKGMTESTRRSSPLDTPTSVCRVGGIARGPSTGSAIEQLPAGSCLEALHLVAGKQ